MKPLNQFRLDSKGLCKTGSPNSKSGRKMQIVHTLCTLMSNPGDTVWWPHLWESRKNSYLCVSWTAPPCDMLKATIVHTWMHVNMHFTAKQRKKIGEYRKWSKIYSLFFLRILTSWESLSRLPLPIIVFQKVQKRLHICGSVAAGWSKHARLFLVWVFTSAHPHKYPHIYIRPKLLLSNAFGLPHWRVTHPSPIPGLLDRWITQHVNELCAMPRKLLDTEDMNHPKMAPHKGGLSLAAHNMI